MKFISKFNKKLLVTDHIILITNVLEIACVRGEFINNLRKKGFNFAYVFEQYMKQIIKRNFILKDPKYISLGIVQLVTLFEKIQQIDKKELDFF